MVFKIPSNPLHCMILCCYVSSIGISFYHMFHLNNMNFSLSQQCFSLSPMALLQAFPREFMYFHSSWTISAVCCNILPKQCGMNDFSPIYFFDLPCWNTLFFILTVIPRWVLYVRRRADAFCLNMPRTFSTRSSCSLLELRDLHLYLWTVQ